MNKNMTYATTTEIAEILDVDRRTIARWRKEGRDVPSKRGDREPLQEWIRWHLKNPDAGLTNSKPGMERDELLAEKLQVQIDLLRIQRDRLQAQHVPRSEVKSDLEKIRRALARFAEMLDEELPKLCLGKNLSQSAPAVKKFIRQQQDILADPQSHFWQD